MHSTSLAVRGKGAMDAHRANRRHDVTLRHEGRAAAGDRRAMARDTIRRLLQRGKAFDASGPSGLAFIAAQLELIDADLTRPLEETYHQRDIDIEVGGGFPEFISAFANSYKSAGNQGYGLQGTNNTEIPQAQVDVQKGLWQTFNWTGGYTITYFDLERMATAARSGQPMPISLQTLYDEAIAGIWSHMLDGLVYTGFQGQYGLVNNANVPSVYSPTNGTSTLWANKSPVQILEDINFGINATVINSGYAFKKGCANTLLLPLQPHFALLTNPMTIGGIGYESTLEYIKKNCVATAMGVPFDILPLPNTWLSGQGQGGSDRGIFYRKDKGSLYLRIPTPAKKAMTIPTTKDGVGYETVYVGNVSQVIFKRTTTQIYMDGI